MSTVAVKMLTLYSSPKCSILPGRVAEFEADEAKALVDGGFAEYVPTEEVKEEPAQEETAAMPEQFERAALPRRSRR